MTLTAIADRSWELFPHGLLVFERSEPSGPSRLLVSRVEACTTQGCSCRDVGLLAVSLDVDDKFDPASLATDSLNAKFATDAMDARLDIDCGSVEPDDYDGRVPLTADWAAYLESQIDGELLDLLHEKWLRGKGITATDKTDWEPRPPGDLVGWHEAHPADRADLYIDDDGVFQAEDLYCVNPTCSCNEAVVVFATRDAPDLGSIRVRLPKLDVVERDVKPGDAAALNRLWTAFSKRHRHLADRLASRKKAMAALAVTHRRQRRPAASSGARIGRNQPCPCGSGKKYKRCCG